MCLTIRVQGRNTKCSKRNCDLLLLLLCAPAAAQVCVLAAPDGLWLARLAEAADLRDRTAITSAEFEQLKASLVAQLRAAV
jgi:hypothetical protein